jgi:hypothetical protein
MFAPAIRTTVLPKALIISKPIWFKRSFNSINQLAGPSLESSAFLFLRGGIYRRGAGQNCIYQNEQCPIGATYL